MQSARNKKRLVAILAIASVAVIVVAVALVVRSFRPPFEPGPVRAARTDGWQRLAVGMTKTEVRTLLGKSESVTVIGGLEMWEYGWTDGITLFAASAKAHAVFFDLDGTVMNFREPVR